MIERVNDDAHMDSFHSSHVALPAAPQGGMSSG